MSRAEWGPSIVPPLGVELSHEQQLACAFRILDRDGFSENLAGHITWTDRDDTTMLVNPWGLWWSELAASDICRVDEGAEVIELSAPPGRGIHVVGRSEELDGIGPPDGGLGRLDDESLTTRTEDVHELEARNESRFAPATGDDVEWIVVHVRLLGRSSRAGRNWPWTR